MSNSAGFSGGLSLGSFDADDDAPTLDLSPADSAAVSGSGHARIRFNLSTQRLEQSISAGAWTAIATGTTAGDSLARYIVQQPNGSLPNAQSLSALGTGIVKSTTGTGVLSIAIPNTDFPATTAQYIVATATAAPPNAQNLGILSSGILKQTVTSGIATIAIAEQGFDSLGPKPGEFWVYCIDYDGLVLPGNDTTGRVGIGTTMAVALASAVATPFKTYERVGQLLPRNGCGALCFIQGKPRTAAATYKKMDGTTDQDASWRSMTGGWLRFVCRPTGNFSNSAADKVQLGFQIVTGTNATGYNPTAGATTTTIPCQLNGGGAAALPAESGGFSSISGKRIRFDAATPTVALRNICTMIIKNTTTQIDTATTLGATPATNDIFYIEETALNFGAGSFQSWDCAQFYVVGERWNTTATVVGTAGTAFNFVGCEATNFTLSSAGASNLISTWIDETGGLGGNIGVGMRATTNITIQNVSGRFGMAATAYLGANGVSLFNVARMNGAFGQGCLWVSGLVDATIASNVGTAASGIGTGQRIIGSQLVGGIIRPRISGATSNVAALILNATGTNVCGVNFSNQTKPLIYLSSPLKQAASIDDCVSPDGGNTDVVIDCSVAKDATILIGSRAANTATATVGDIRLADGAIATIAGLATTNYIDSGDNLILGSAGKIVSNIMPLTNSNGTTLNQFSLVRANNTTGQMVLAQANTSINASGVLGTVINNPANAGIGLIVPANVPTWIQFNAVPTVGKTAYLSPTTAGAAQDSQPFKDGLNQVVPLGIIEKVNGTLGFVVPGPSVAIGLTTELLHSGLSIPARSIANSGVFTDLVATASGQFLRRDGNNTLGFGKITTADIQDILDTFRTPKLDEWWVYCIDYDRRTLVSNDSTAAPGIASPPTRAVIVTGSDNVVGSTRTWTFTNGNFTSVDINGYLVVGNATNANSWQIASVTNSTTVVTKTTNFPNFSNVDPPVNETFTGSTTLTVIGGPAATFNLALSRAVTTPFKTYERAGQLLPRNGNGASMMTLVRPRTNRAVYKDMDGISECDWDKWIKGCYNWNYFGHRPTLDFSNSALDKVSCGYRIIPGLNSGGYNPTVGRTITVNIADNVVASTKRWTFANGNFTVLDIDRNLVLASATNAGTYLIAEVINSTTLVTTGTPVNETFSSGSTTLNINSSTRSFSCQLAGGGSANLPANGTVLVDGVLQTTIPFVTAITGKRIRFDPNTTTVALRNFCTGVYSNDAGNIVPMFALPAIAAVSDVFYIEENELRIGVMFVRLGYIGRISFVCGYSIRMGGPFFSYKTYMTALFSGIDAPNDLGSNHLTFDSIDGRTFVSHRYIDETATIINIGAAGTGRLTPSNTRGGFIVSAWFGCEGTQRNWYNNQWINVGPGCVFIAGFWLQNGSMSGDIWTIGDAVDTGSGALADESTGIGSDTTDGIDTNGAFGGPFGTFIYKRTRFPGNTTPSQPQGNGGIIIAGRASVRIHGVDFSNMFPCIQVRGDGGHAFVDDIVTTQGGNALLLTVENAYRANVVIGTFNSIAFSPNTSKDPALASDSIRLAGTGGYGTGPIVSVSGLAFTNYRDIHDNLIQGTGGVIV